MLIRVSAVADPRSSFNSLIAPATKAASPGFVWTKTATGSGAEVGYDVAATSNGDVVVAGNFNSTNVSFGNITLSNVVRTAGASMDCFLEQWSGSMGEKLWQRWRPAHLQQ